MKPETKYAEELIGFEFKPASGAFQDLNNSDAKDENLLKMIFILDYLELLKVIKVLFILEKD